MQGASGMPVNNPRLVQIIRGHFHVYLVAHGDANEIFSHFSGNMGEDFMPVGQRHPEHRARQYLRHIPGQFNWLFFRHSVIEPFTIAITAEKSIIFVQKTSGQSPSFG